MRSAPLAFLLALALGVGVSAGIARAADEPESAAEEGRFAVHTAYTELIDGVYFLNADVEFSLNEAALKALEASLPLTVRFEIEIIRKRRFIWDETVARLEHVDQIAYHPLSQRYLVRELSTGEVESFGSYRAAIARLGQVSDVALINESLLDPNSKYRIRVRAVLDLSEYSAPLRVYASLWQSWTIRSDWYEWVLR